MGKYKGNKPKIRNNPVGLPSVKETLLREIETLDGDGDVGFVPNLIDQLKSHVVEERDSALNSLSIACQNPRILEELLEADVVSVAGSLLIDPSAMVRHSAAGSLRNISTAGPVICELMVSEDIMTPLATLLKKHYAADWQPKKKEGKIDTVTETFIEAVNLLWNLCESSEVALQRFNQEGLAEVVLRGLNVEAYGVRVCIPVAQLLHAVTEENPDLVSKMESLESVFEKLVSTDMGTDVESKYLQTLAIGILLNMKGGSISRVSGGSLATFADILSSSLKLDHLETIKRLVSREDFLSSNDKNGRNIELEAAASEGGNEEESMETSITVEEEVQAVMNTLNAQILSMTIFSNLLCTDDDGDDNSDDESSESVTDFNGDGEENSMECDDGWVSNLAPEVQEIVVSRGLKGILLEKMGQPEPDVLELLNKTRSGVKILQLLNQLRTTACLCFQNLVDLLELSELGGTEETEAVFASSTLALASEAVDVSRDTSLSAIEAITSLQRAVVQKWTEGKVLKPMTWFKPETLNVFVEVYQKLNVAKIHTNIIKVIGGFGILLSRIERRPENEKIVTTILGQVGEFLLQCVCEPFERDHLPVAAEALDTIFDVFAEDDYNDVLRQLGMIDKLKKFLPAYKKLIQSQRRQLAEHKAIVQTSKTNLSRFITYKTQHGCC